MTGHRPFTRRSATMGERVEAVLAVARQVGECPAHPLEDQERWVTRMRAALAQVFLLGMDIGWDKRQAVLEDEDRTAARRWAYGLTADEWLALACEGTESEVPPCCGDLSDIRELLHVLATFQGPGNASWRRAAGAQLLERLGPAGDGGHELDDPAKFPLLARVVAGVRAEQAAAASLARHPATGRYCPAGTPAGTGDTKGTTA